jgi:hypothetical protein
MRHRAIGILVAAALFGCDHSNTEGAAAADTAAAPTASATPSAAETTAATAQPSAAPAATPTTTAAADKGDEASARALLEKFLAPGADAATLTKALRPTAADYAALFDAPTAAKLQPQYDKFWDKDPMVIRHKAEQTELKLWASTTEELQSGSGGAREFPGGWKKIAPHLAPHQTWYRFEFVKPGETLGMAYDGLAFVHGHWVITPKPYRGL